MSCEYCEGKEQMLVDWSNGATHGVYIALERRADEARLHARGYCDKGACGFAEKKINFCPMCGQDLRKSI